MAPSTFVHRVSLTLLKKCHSLCVSLCYKYYINVISIEAFDSGLGAFRGQFYAGIVLRIEGNLITPIQRNGSNRTCNLPLASTRFIRSACASIFVQIIIRNVIKVLYVRFFWVKYFYDTKLLDTKNNNTGTIVISYNVSLKKVLPSMCGMC